MAKPIVELWREPLKHKLVAVHVLYLYSVDPPVNVDGVIVKLTPRNTLPDGVEFYQLISSDELTRLENGTGMFIQDRIEQLKGESVDDVLMKAKTRYEKGWLWLAQQRKKYAHTGDRHALSA